MAQRDKKEWMIQMEWYRLNKKYLTLYIELVIASVLYVIPVILADRYYNDDLSRALYGARGWQKDGRPLGDVLMILLTGGGGGWSIFRPFHCWQAYLSCRMPLFCMQESTWTHFPGSM